MHGPEDVWRAPTAFDLKWETVLVLIQRETASGILVDIPFQSS